MIYLFVLILISLNNAFALDISKAPFNAFPEIKSLAGLHNLSIIQDTPPSTQTTNWWILLTRDSKDAGKIGHSCPDDSTLCGETLITVDNDKEILTQLFSVNEKDASIIGNVNDGINVTWTGAKWGEHLIDVTLLMKCSTESSSSSDSIEWVGETVGLFGPKIDLRWYNTVFCANGSPGNGDDDNDQVKSGSGLGWFTSLFLISFVIFAGYLVGQAWFNTSTMGSSSDFLNELTDVVVDNLARIPMFVGEVISKITGGGSNRGGYSAV